MKYVEVKSGEFKTVKISKDENAFVRLYTRNAQNDTVFVLFAEDKNYIAMARELSKIQLKELYASLPQDQNLTIQMAGANKSCNFMYFAQVIKCLKQCIEEQCAEVQINIRKEYTTVLSDIEYDYISGFRELKYLEYLDSIDL